MKEINRKSLLYKTDVEYGDYTINHILGCSHGCLYHCYAFMMARRFGRVKDYQEWCKPALVSNAMPILRNEIPRYKNKIKSVHLCFTTDPFMFNHPEVTDLSLRIIELLNKHNIKVTCLTKGIIPQELANYSKLNEYGITLISLSETFRLQMEPYSAPYTDRINSLKDLHDQGYKTWVSIEPYPTPNIIEQNFSDILNSISFVDKVIFGRLHYNTSVTKYKDYQLFYNTLAEQTIEFCKNKGIEYHIKNKTVVL